MASPAERRIRYRRKNPTVTAIHQMVRDAVKRGLLQKPLCCEECRGPFPARLLIGHHDDYARPLDVRWLCNLCHRRWHKRHGKGANFPDD